MEATLPSVIISGIGTCLPENVVTNEDLTLKVDTSDEWIRSRTGIAERRIAGPGENIAAMGAKAGQNAIDDAGLKSDQIDCIVCATMTPELSFPATACLIQDAMGLSRIPAFDISAACSGFIYGMEVVSRLVQSGAYKRVLLVGTEKMSSAVDWDDRATCVLFGDGAGACIIEQSEKPEVGVRDILIGSQGSKVDLLYAPAGGSKEPVSEETISNRRHYLRMNGKEVFKLAVKEMGNITVELLERNGLSPDDVKCIIPHQANVRIIDSLAGRLELPRERFLINIDRYGNTSAASIPIALEEARRSGHFQAGDNIVLAAFGAGLTWGGALIKWH